MNTLNHLSKIKKLDSGRVLESIESVSDQLWAGWQGIMSFTLPSGYQDINHVVVNGMGGSALASQIIRAVFTDRLAVPFEVINGYQLPKSVNQNTLYLIYSYSGTTEEPISTIELAKQRGAKIFGVTSGGELAQLITGQKIPGYIFDPKFNPSNQPRMGLGYALGIQLGLLTKLGLLQITESEITNLMDLAKELTGQFGVGLASTKNPAKKLALGLKNKTTLIVGSEFLTGNIHVLANQLNENAKSLATYFVLPELNHHLLEGLTFPKDNRRRLTFFFFASTLYDPRNQKRLAVTQKVLTKNKIKFLTYELKSSQILAQAFEALILGSYLSFYLAILNGINPSQIPWVDYFKAELKKN